MRTPGANQNQIVDAGSAQVSSLHGVAPDLGGHLTWRLINDADGSTVIAESSDQIVEIDDGNDPPLVRYDRPYPAPLLAGTYLAIWRYYSEEAAQNVVVATSAEATFAFPDDVATRMGRPLTSDETSAASLLLNIAAAVIAEAAGYDDGWAVTLDPVPQLLRGLSIELACRNLQNPGQFAQLTQTVGAYSFSGRQATVGMVLSDAEVMMVRRTVHGRVSDSAHLESSFEKAQDEYWLRKQSVRFADPQDPANVIP